MSRCAQSIKISKYGSLISWYSNLDQVFCMLTCQKKKTSKQETSLVSLYFLHWTAHLLQRKIKPRKDIFSSMKLLRVLKLRPFSFIQLPHRTTVHLTKIQPPPTSLSKIKMTIQQSGQDWCPWMKICSTVRPWDARFWGNGETCVAQNLCNLNYFNKAKVKHQTTEQFKVFTS